LVKTSPRLRPTPPPAIWQPTPGRRPSTSWSTGPAIRRGKFSPSPWVTCSTPPSTGLRMPVVEDVTDPQKTDDPDVERGAAGGVRGGGSRARPILARQPGGQAGICQLLGRVVCPLSGGDSGVQRVRRCQPGQDGALRRQF